MKSRIVYTRNDFGNWQKRKVTIIDNEIIVTDMKTTDFEKKLGYSKSQAINWMEC